MPCFLSFSTFNLYFCNRKKEHSPLHPALRHITIMVHVKERKELAGDRSLLRHILFSRILYGTSELPPLMEHASVEGWRQL